MDSFFGQAMKQNASGGSDTTESTFSDPSFWIVVLLGAIVFLMIGYILWKMSRYYRTHPTRENDRYDIELAPLARVRIEEMRAFLFRSAVHTPHTGEKCTWCIFEFEVGDELSALPPCRHAFHTVCIAEFMERERVCPSCRRIISLPYDIAAANDMADDIAM